MGPDNNTVVLCANITIPAAAEYFHRIVVENLVLTIIAVVLTIAMVILFAFEIYYIFKYISPYTDRAGKLAYMTGVQPVTAVGCLIALCVPRSQNIVEMFILLYFARCLFTVTQVVVDFFGNRLEMSRALQGTTIRMNTLPVCCCCVFLPSAQPTVLAIRRIEWLVYQTAIVRPFLFLITGTIDADFGDNATTAQSLATATKITNILNIVSTLTAMYGFTLMAKMTDKPLKPYRIPTLMKLIQITIIIYNIQGGILSLLAQQGVISCSDILPAVQRAAAWNFFLLIVESFLIAIGAALLLRPSVNALFDQYPGRSANPTSKNPRNWDYDQAGTPSSTFAPVADPRDFADLEVQQNPVKVEDR